MLIPAALLGAALACLIAAWLLLRSLGQRYRVARLLAATPAVGIAEARALATETPTYVRVSGRLSSDEEFPDENDRPLVYRHKRIEIAAAGTSWRTVADEREAVPFGIETRSEYIAIDEAALDVGLVAISRESTGSVADLPDELRSDLPDASPEAAARLVVEQVSAVEHATACGVPIERDGRVVLSAGLGRPLILTTLDVPDAMRLIAAPHRRRVRAAAAALGGGALLALAAVVAAVAGL